MGFTINYYSDNKINIISFVHTSINLKFYKMENITRKNMNSLNYVLHVLVCVHSKINGINFYCSFFFFVYQKSHSIMPGEKEIQIKI